MGLILDIVPNHMGAGKDNPWWMDVLENGTSSLYATYFDIDWHPLTDDLQNKFLLPILGGSYGNIMKNGELKPRFDAETARFWLDYYEHPIPINPNSYSIILGHRLEILEARLGKTAPAFLEYQSISSAFDRLPVETQGDLLRKEERARERTIALNRLISLITQTLDVLIFIQENVQDFQFKLDDPTNIIRLHRLLEHQAYRLANWRVASDEINYRRFFDVNDLVAVRVEDPRVFSDTHELILELIGKGWVSGLRIDHPDGLYDPAAYFSQLQEEAAKRLGLLVHADWQLSSENLPIYVLIEKILAPFERLPQEWKVQGTTGYEFANQVNGLFVDQQREKEMTRCYEKVLGARVEFEDWVYQCKKLIMKTTLNSELGVLTQQLYRLSKRNWSYRDFTLHNLRDAIMEVVSCFPVYRTYVTENQVSKKDGEYIEWAVRLAKRRSQAIDTTIYDFIRSILLLEATSESLKETTERTLTETQESQEFYRLIIRFAMKFQQYSGPVMAKGLEDTSFYRYNRLVSLNEVGGEPGQFGISVSTFHHHNLDRSKRLPHSLLATSTHDTKRSEDVRARISVLSELPEEWQKQLTKWLRMNRHWRKEIDTGVFAPSSNDEYLFYQTLLGVWPFNFSPSPENMENLCARLEAYMQKAAREAKSYTSWVNPNTDYEEALSQYIRGILLKPSKLFLDNFIPFQKMIARFGVYNSLSQSLLKLTCPGVPDIYQGSELWDFSLVDPDNRKPVNYPQRQEWLGQCGALLEDTLPCPDTYAILFRSMTENLTDGRLKQAMIALTLRLRRLQPELFRKGAYLPLEVVGTHAAHVVAFARQWEGQSVIVVTPRLLYSMLGRKNLWPCGKRIWKDTHLILPEPLGKLTFLNLFNGESVTMAEVDGQSTIEIAEIFRQLPLGLLENQAHN